MRAVLFFLIIICYSSVNASDSLIITKLLQRIDALQAKNDIVFPQGSIPSYRMYAHNRTRYKADINPFFTALTAFTLHDIKKDLSPSQLQLATAIIQNTATVYSKFKSQKKDRFTYNFWPTDQPQIFTHSGWLNLLNKSKSLPDDLDDTVIILMAEQASDSIANEVHQLMQAHANNTSKRVNNTFSDYHHLPAYSTWFGKKMAIDLDISVLTNILYFVQYYQLPWTSADSASLLLIEDAIRKNRHITAANYISTHYARLPVILYHISRLMALKPIASLEKLKPQLIEDTKKALSTANTFMDQVILSTALLRWGIVPPEIQIQDKSPFIDLIEDERFYFFIANMGSIMPDQKKKFMTKTKLGTFYYYCPAYNHVLLLENLVWRKRMGRLTQ